MTAYRYLLVSLASLAAALLAVAVLNYFVDPYLVFGQPRRAGFNQIKPAADSREWLMKAYEAPRQQPRTVVLGSSRSNIGLVPASPTWPAQWQPVYNLSLAGSDLGLNLQYLKHLLRAQGDGAALRTVVVGLDFESFLQRPAGSAKPAAADPQELEATARLDAWAAGSPLGRLRIWQDRAESLVTLDALMDSGSTLLANRAPARGADLAADGHYSDGQLRQWTQTDGVAQLFRQKNQDTLRGFKPPRRSLASADGTTMNGQADIADLFAIARQRQLKLVLLLQPSHASRLELLDALGYWAEFEGWKRRLSSLAEAARAAGTDAVVWDFSGYEPEHLEAMPAKNQARTPLQWYWDPVHYRPAIGDRMVQAFATDQGGSLGAALTPATVEARLQRVRIDRAAYRAAHAGEVARLHALVCPGPSCAAPTAP